MCLEFFSKWEGFEDVFLGGVWWSGMFFLFMLGVHFGCMDVLKDVKGVETWSFLLEVAARGWRR